MTPQPYTLHIPDADIADLKDRLARTRLPDQTPGGRPWQFGTERDYLADLVAYWRDDFDWRAAEAALNALSQFKVRLHDIDLHYVEVQGEGANPTPLLLLHGWPGSVFEFLEIIPRLTTPSKFGGDPEEAFTVIAPSLPGFGCSFTPGQKRCGVSAMADLFADLMTDVLGHDRFGAQGGDWGSFICSSLADRHPEKLIGLHQNMIPIRPDATAEEGATEEERRYAEEIAVWAREEAGYIWIQGSRPQTLAYGLADSPAGLAAWIAEKFHQWTDHDGDHETAINRDDLLANISLYWFTGAIGSSFWPYYERLNGEWPVPEGRTIVVPFAYAAFPREIRRPPRSLAERTYSDIRQWTVMKKGGHFAAMEQPEALASDVAQFFRSLKT